MNEAQHGGVPFMQGSDECWFFGWKSPDQDVDGIHLPDARFREHHETLVDSMPDFQIQGQWRVGGQALLWEASKAALGHHLECFHQDVGSCTGQGKGKAEYYLMCCEALRGEPEKPIMPYVAYGYAQGRVCAGISGNQDGGTGSGCAEAAQKFGVLQSDLKDLPPWQLRGTTVYWDGKTERAWGARGAPAQYVAEGKRHLVHTTAPVRSANEVAQALQNHFPVTIASNWGGQMEPAPQGNPAVRLNRRVTSWMHQMMVCGWWDHPTLKEIFYIQNSWGEDAHGTPLNDEPPGGFWITKSDMQFIVGQNDSFAYSQFDGFPADAIPWIV